MDSYQDDPSTDTEGEPVAPEGMSKDEFMTAYARESADYADAVLADRRGEFVPTVGFHTTTPENYDDGIRTEGLDPMRGGVGGASEAAGEGTTFADGAEDYASDSRGHVYYGAHLDSAQKYTEVYDEAGKDATVLGVTLEHPRTEHESRIDALDLANYSTRPHRDPADEDEDEDYDDEFRTRRGVPPENIVDLGHVDELLVHSPDPDIAQEAQERLDE